MPSLWHSEDNSDRLTTLTTLTTRNEHPSEENKDHEPAIINNQQSEEVEEFTYLRCKPSTDGDSGKDVQARLAKANQAFGSLNTVWKSKQLRVKNQDQNFPKQRS